MKILAIETSTLTGGVALQDDGRLIGETTLSVSVRHSERLIPAVERLLADAGTKVSDIDLFAVAVGPGSFTGLRIGIAAAQGLALANDKPIFGISTLEALACNGLVFPGLIVPLLDAYRGEVYRGLYRAGDGIPVGVTDERVSGIDRLLEELAAQKGPILLLGDGGRIHGDRIRDSLGPDRVTIASQPLLHPRAANVAFLASKKWTSNEPCGLVLPRYLRVPG